MNVPLVDLAEWLYRIRLGLGWARSQNKRSAEFRIGMDHFGAVERDLMQHLRNAGLDPGKTATEADELKLRLLREKPMTAESITDRTIDQMLARPEMHAKTPEILEAVVLRLLELDEMSKLPPQRGDHHIIDLVANRYTKWCEEWGRVETFPAMVESLKNFVNEERQR